MRPLICALSLALLAAPAAAQPETDWNRFAAREIQLRDVAALVRVTPENRRDVAVRIRNPGPLPAPQLRLSRARLTIDGNAGRIRSCRTLENGGFEATVDRRGRLQTAQLTVIELRVPQDVVVSVSGAVRMHVGAAQSLRARVAGCGETEIESLAGAADLSVAGAPDVRLYEAESARISLAGAGDVLLGAIRNGLTVSIAGAGDVTAAHVDGPTSIVIQGAGDVTIREGRADPLTVTVAGAGDVIHNGVAASLNVTVVGAGDVRVRRVEGEVSRRVLGSGDVVVSQR